MGAPSVRVLPDDGKTAAGQPYGRRRPAGCGGIDLRAVHGSGGIEQLSLLLRHIVVIPRNEESVVSEPDDRGNAVVNATRYRELGPQLRSPRRIEDLRFHRPCRRIRVGYVDPRL